MADDIRDLPFNEAARELSRIESELAARKEQLIAVVSGAPADLDLMAQWIADYGSYVNDHDAVFRAEANRRAREENISYGYPFRTAERAEAALFVEAVAQERFDLADTIRQRFPPNDGYISSDDLRRMQSLEQIDYLKAQSIPLNQRIESSFWSLVETGHVEQAAMVFHLYPGRQDEWSQAENMPSHLRVALHGANFNKKQAIEQNLPGVLAAASELEGSARNEEAEARREYERQLAELKQQSKAHWATADALIETITPGMDIAPLTDWIDRHSQLIDAQNELYGKLGNPRNFRSNASDLVFAHAVDEGAYDIADKISERHSLVMRYVPNGFDPSHDFKWTREEAEYLKSKGYDVSQHYYENVFAGDKDVAAIVYSLYPDNHEAWSSPDNAREQYFERNGEQAPEEITATLEADLADIKARALSNMAIIVPKPAEPAPTTVMPRRKPALPEKDAAAIAAAKAEREAAAEALKNAQLLQTALAGVGLLVDGKGDNDQAAIRDKISPFLESQGFEGAAILKDEFLASGASYILANETAEAVKSTSEDGHDEDELKRIANVLQTHLSKEEAIIVDVPGQIDDKGFDENKRLEAEKAVKDASKTIGSTPSA